MNAITRIAIAAVGGLLVASWIASADEATTQKPNQRTIEDRAGCVVATGSRIATTHGRCVRNGRSYNERDIRQTGATTAADALRLLDPAVSIHR